MLSEAVVRSLLAAPFVWSATGRTLCRDCGGRNDCGVLADAESQGLLCLSCAEGAAYRTAGWPCGHCGQETRSTWAQGGGLRPLCISCCDSERTY